MIATVPLETAARPKQDCIVCGNDRIVPMIAIDRMPILCSVQWPTREDALNAPCGNIDLGFCPECGHIYNRAFDPGILEYSDAYDSSLHYSASFNRYAEALADRLIDKYRLHGKNIIEIGCGKGEFLAMLCERGDNRGLGFDVSYEPERAQASERITFIKDYFQEKYLETDADLVVCRHVLEHISHPASFLATVRQALGERTQTAVYFEVPNALFTLKDLGIWDLIYEHCSYFTPASLHSAFVRAAFRVSKMDIAFYGQFLTIEAIPAPEAMQLEEPPEISRKDEELVRLGRYVAVFQENYSRKLEEWRARLQSSREQRKRTVLWGAGSKGVMFLNALAPGNPVEYVVDINPHKQGLYVPGSSQQIVPPEFLATYRPDQVIVMNPIYREEIRRQLEGLGVAAEVCCA
ncbi:class I SAM-dependent methyltransferase [Methylocaldum sp.]|uniref:class I SAM-dependent methyltransferase n=1 Tax=Methylocaldum sp. TaxID=1969727 RepID=UPI002D6F230E|nr:class I SAM-dependent methyltransferase [Methylocaldum sp.]HYE35697.1 class I SAM-dependent methyltransferase [Methylocaldum sp.]